jgi:hypothetical protein
MTSLSDETIDQWTNNPELHRAWHEAANAIAGRPEWQLLVPAVFPGVRRRATLWLPAQADVRCDVMYNSNGHWYWVIFWDEWHYRVTDGLCDSCLAGVEACEALIARASPKDNG